jgi:tetraacyldisaccharide 4'-kinase
MPMGDLREPIGGLRRAGVVLLNGARELGDEARRALFDKITRLAPNALILACVRRPAGLTDRDGVAVDLDWLRGRDVIAFCGIGRPDSFFDALESLGARVRERLPFPDHHKYTDADLALIESRRESLGVEAVVTTEKDRARLEKGGFTESLYVLGVELEIEERSRLAELISHPEPRRREPGRRVDRSRQGAATEEAAD